MSTLVRIGCAADQYTQCGDFVTEAEENKIPYICPKDYRDGWRAEGLRTRPKELKVYRLPAEQRPGPV